ncbi:MAG: di-heme oxidoredictase family protein [Planctomycetota bacterium]|jgi:CxxC motif-containing protein (DUF1111 family)
MRRYTVLSLALVGCGLVWAGIVAPGSPIPAPGTAGAPHSVLSPQDAEAFLRGRALFDKDFGVGAGVGPVFNGDSCRSCHQDPVIGGGGGIDVQVQRPAISDGNGGFISPPSTGGLAQTHSIPGTPREVIPDDVVFVEERNSPTGLGLGLVETISDATILANEDPDDEDDDGVKGIAHIMADDSIGRFGWKAQVPDLESFARDALSNEMGITVPDNGNPFGDTGDDGDDALDPEISQSQIDDLVVFMRALDFAPKKPETQQTLDGAAIFVNIGCAKCHVQVMDGVELLSDLLLHDVQPDGFLGVTQGMATSGLYRTALLRGLRHSAPYFHDGRSETVDHAIRRHDGEAQAIREEYEGLSAQQRAALLAYLDSR